MNSCVSVIMPVYNTKTYLGTALDSVLKQSWVDFEIIIVDDGSKDGSRALIQQYAEKYPEKIRYFFQENGGAAHARNTGLKNAKGGYVAFLDSDDLWMSNKLQIQINYFQKNPEVDL
ncbi:MAG: glycosyltransferase family 2 protein, partial [Candidatus Omnitrophica bacterium]|nr:glycosyltransferase family 2 protein [Candidatus Omnitrophota bacterium]